MLGTNALMNGLMKAKNESSAYCFIMVNSILCGCNVYPKMYGVNKLVVWYKCRLKGLLGVYQLVESMPSSVKVRGDMLRGVDKVSCVIRMNA